MAPSEGWGDTFTKPLDEPHPAAWTGLSAEDTLPPVTTTVRRASWTVVSMRAFSVRYSDLFEAWYLMEERQTSGKAFLNSLG